MKKDLRNDLTVRQQARLDKWMANPLPVKSLIEMRKQGMFISRKENRHDIDDEEEYLKERHKNNPNFKGYT